MQYVSAQWLLGFDRPASSKADHPTLHGSWHSRFDDVGRVQSAFTRNIGDTLHLPGLDGRAHLIVMCTDWSGALEMRAGDCVSHVDTFAREHTVREFEVPGWGVRDVSVTVLDRPNPSTHDNQLWLHGLKVERRQRWASHALPLTPMLEVVNGSFGTFMTFSKDVGISHSIKTFGAWAPEQVELFKRLVRPGMVVVDVGANIGHHSVVLSKLAGPSGKIFAFEPQQMVYRVLEANLALNGCTHAEAFRCALGATEGEARMAPLDYEHDAWNVGGLGIEHRGQHEGGANGQSVAVRRLDDVLGTAPVDFIKCDAQGFDFEVLKGARSLLKAHRPMVLIEVAPLSMLGGTEVYLEMYAALQKLGYRLLDPQAPSSAKAPRMWSGEPEEWDVLAVQDRHLKQLGIGA